MVHPPFETGLIMKHLLPSADWNSRLSVRESRGSDTGAGSEDSLIIQAAAGRPISRKVLDVEIASVRLHRDFIHRD